MWKHSVTLLNDIHTPHTFTTHSLTHDRAVIERNGAALLTHELNVPAVSPL